MTAHDHLEFVDGSTLGVEVDSTTVDLVHRDSAGEIALGIMLTPPEARRLGETLITAASRAEAVIPLESLPRPTAMHDRDDAKEES